MNCQANVSRAFEDLKKKVSCYRTTSMDTERDFAVVRGRRRRGDTGVLPVIVAHVGFVTCTAHTS